MNNEHAVGYGGGFLGMLTILFIGLKLTHYIDWSWWWVLAPLWVPFVAVIGIVGVLILITSLMKDKKNDE